MKRVSSLTVFLLLLFLTLFSCAKEAPVVESQVKQQQSVVSVNSELGQPADLALGLKKPITLRYGHGEPMGWPDTEAIPGSEEAMAITFKTYVEAKSNGMITVEIFGNSVLGSNKQMGEMVQQGSLDICTGTGFLGAYFPQFELINIPYAFQADEVAFWVFDNSQYWSNLMKEMEQQIGVTYLGISQNGVRNFTNNIREIRSPEDMKGLKFRVMETPIYVKMIEALGASAVPIAWTELYTALQTGVVDGEENPVASIAIGKLQEVQKYLTMDGHVWSEDIMIMNSGKFNGFSYGVQQLLKSAARRAAIAGRSSEEFRSRIIDFEKVAKDMQIYTPSADEIRQFKEMAQPPVIEWIKTRVAPEKVDGFFAAISEAEMALGYRN